MILDKLSDRVFYLPHNDNTDRPALGYIMGDKFSVMIDTGNSPNHLELFNEGLKERSLPKPRFAIITHWHWDHTFAMCAFDGTIIANSITNKQLHVMKNWVWDNESMLKRLETGEDIEFCDIHMRLEYPNLSDITVRTANIVYDKTLNLDLGNISCECTVVGGPHSDDSTLIYIPEEKILFAGDADSVDFYHNKGNYDKEKLNNYINLLKTIPFELYIHGHVEPMNKDGILKDLSNELSDL